MPKQLWKCLKLFAQRLLILSLIMSSMTAHAGYRVVYYHNDALGSALAGSDESGAILWRQSYRPYGEQGGVMPSPEPIGYTGHVQDKELGLVYMGARYYDPALGRFMGMDPVGFSANNPASFNPYMYANNNPYKYVDPDGRLNIRATIQYGRVQYARSKANPADVTRAIMISWKNQTKEYAGHVTTVADGMAIAGAATANAPLAGAASAVSYLAGMAEAGLGDSPVKDMVAQTAATLTGMKAARLVGDVINEAVGNAASSTMKNGIKAAEEVIGQVVEDQVENTTKDAPSKP